MYYFLIVFTMLTCFMISDVSAQIVRYQGPDGRIYFLNKPYVPAAPPSSGPSANASDKNAPGKIYRYKTANGSILLTDSLTGMLPNAPAQQPQTMEAWHQEWFAYEQELRAWCIKHNLAHLEACMQEEMAKHEVSPAFFIKLRAESANIGTISPQLSISSPNASRSGVMGITPAGFAAIQMGMSYAEVCRILGPPTRTVTETMSTWMSFAGYAWALLGVDGWDRAAIYVSFEDDKVYQKKQHGLP